MAKQPIIGIMYDFDKTLSTTDMQNYDFIPNLGMSPEEFWGATSEFTAKEGVERILSYMYMMIAKCKEKGIKLTKKELNSMGKNIQYFPGVETWFKRINAYGKKKGVNVEHYLVSSGTKEIVEGCSIAKEFKEIYKCDVVVIPPNKPCIRKDLPDVIYKTVKEKFNAIVEHIIEIHERKQPVLVGTISIEKSEFSVRNSS